MSEFKLNFGDRTGNSDDENVSGNGDTVVTLDNFVDHLKFDGTRGVFLSVEGVENKNDLEEYAEKVHTVFDELKDAELTYSYVEGRFTHADVDKNLDSLHRFWGTVTKIPNITAEMITQYTFDYADWNLESSLRDRVRDALLFVTEMYMEKQTNVNIVKNFIVEMWSWIDTYISSEKFDRSIVIHFGEVKRNDVYFLLLLNRMGSNVLHVSPDKDKTVRELASKYVSVVDWKDAVDMTILPKRPQVRRVETAASKASREIHSLLNSGSVGIYSPWQFEDYGVKVTALDTTYEEIIQLWKEPANMRTGFDVKDGVVYVPNMFAKISGVPEIVDNYWIDVADLREGNTVFKESVPFTPNVYVHKNGIIYGNDGFTLSDVRKLSEYRFNHVRESMQEMMIERLNTLIENADSIFRFDGVTTNDFKYRALHTVLALESVFVDQIQKFDYAQDIPKLVIFDGDDKVCSEEDAIVLVFLHLIGFDIVILTPTGYQNIEHLISKSYFEVHKKKKFEMGLTLPKFGVKERVIGDGTKKKSWLQRLFE